MQTLIWWLKQEDILQTVAYYKYPLLKEILITPLSSELAIYRIGVALMKSSASM